MRSLNRVFLIGHVGNDPDVRTTYSGRKVANFRMATNRVWKTSEGGTRQETEWHRIVVFGNLADIVDRYLKKGRYVFVEGRLQTRSYTDREGVERFVTEIVATNIMFLEPLGRTRDFGDETRIQTPAGLEPIEEEDIEDIEEPSSDDTTDFFM